MKGRADPYPQEGFVKKLEDVMLSGGELLPSEQKPFRSRLGGHGRHENDTGTFCPLDFDQLPRLKE
jgi:hypothetical protein